LISALLASLVAAAVVVFVPTTVAAQQPVKMEATSDQGAFKVEVTWTPGEVGEDNVFAIRFIEPDTVTELEDMKYDISIFRGDERESRRVDQVSLQQTFRFEEAGSYTVMIEDIDGLGEGAAFPIEVTPEFPAGTIALAAAVVIGGAILAARRNNLFTQKNNYNSNGK
jgi:hypothetical protein